MEVTCYHCGHTWDYNGKSKYYATCTNCMKKVNLDKANRLMGESEEK